MSLNHENLVLMEAISRSANDKPTMLLPCCKQSLYCFVVTGTVEFFPGLWTVEFFLGTGPFAAAIGAAEGNS